MSKRYRTIAAIMGAAALLSTAPYVYAEEAMEVAQEAVEVAQAVEVTQESTVEPSLSSELPYMYESTAYGYWIMCPQRPVGVIPANALFENSEGEILIFDNEEYHIKYAWVVLSHAFSEDALPDLNTITPEETETLLKRIMGSNGYESITLVDLNNDNKALFAITAKEIEIDEDGDGVTDATATTDRQMAVLFFRGSNGGCYGLELIDNPDLRSTSVSTFLAGARTIYTLP